MVNDAFPGWGEKSDPTPRTGYVVKVYPRFSETFVVTEVLAREAAGDDLTIFGLRPTTDARFHPELAMVRAPVVHLTKPTKLTDGWAGLASAQEQLPDFAERFASILPYLARIDATDALQGIDLAIAARRRGIEHLHAHFASVAARVAYVASVLADITFSVTTHAKDIFHADVDADLLGEVLGAASTVVAISEYNQGFLEGQYPEVTERIRLVRNGIDVERFTYSAPTPVGDTLRVAAVGRLVEKKGFDVLVDAAALARDRGLSLEVRIAGDGELREDLEAQITAAGLEGTVTLLGPRGQDEIRDLLRWADVLVAPCVVGRDGNADGLPTVLLEAMAMGVPCVSTAVTGIPEAIHPASPEGPATGLLLPPGDVEAVAAAMEDAARPDFPRTEIARSARALIETEFDSRVQARRLADVTAPSARPAPQPTGAVR
ncbi:glycosyltransferase [Nostocoides sp. F2B08]|uniref:glycosyltransferase n=1 Tax=Nostocoides sp. F2B08 TaxID=2653936 RepID=UPI001D041CBD|nr:glycosyltransferase [Tetrasphaera sp. F2B08]